MKLFLILSCVAALCVSPGCGNEKRPVAGDPYSEKSKTTAAYDNFATQSNGTGGVAAKNSDEDIFVPTVTLVAQATQATRAFATRGATDTEPVDKSKRQIIHSATVTLVVDAFEGDHRRVRPNALPA